MNPMLRPESIGYVVVGCLVVAPAACLAEVGQSSSSAMSAQHPAWISQAQRNVPGAVPVIHAGDVQAVPSAPGLRDLPGSNITLTHPVNVLQPIPPATSKLPSPLN